VPPIGRASIGITLGLAFLICAGGAAVCHLIASNSPRSEVMRRLMEHEHQSLSGTEALYEAGDELLSARGVAFRARARNFGRVATALAVLIFAWAAWAN
jgi:hypothetical protein